MKRHSPLVRLYVRLRRLQRRPRPGGSGLGSLINELLTTLLRFLIFEASVGLYTRICVEVLFAAGANKVVNSVLIHEDWDSTIIHVLMKFMMFCFGVDVVLRSLDGLGIPLTHWLRKLRRYLMTGGTARSRTAGEASERQAGVAPSGGRKVARKLVWLAALALVTAALTGGAIGFYLSGAVLQWMR